MKVWELFGSYVTQCIFNIARFVINGNLCLTKLMVVVFIVRFYLKKNILLFAQGATLIGSSVNKYKKNI
jgi:hypothetical protein